VGEGEGNAAFVIGLACAFFIYAEIARTFIGTRTSRWERFWIVFWTAFSQSLPVILLEYPGGVTPVLRTWSVAELVLTIGYTAYLIRARRASRN
jgi:hypothetical protein